MTPFDHGWGEIFVANSVGVDVGQQGPGHLVLISAWELAWELVRGIERTGTLESVPVRFYLESIPVR